MCWSKGYIFIYQCTFFLSRGQIQFWGHKVGIYWASFPRLQCLNHPIQSRGKEYTIQGEFLPNQHLLNSTTFNVEVLHQRSSSDMAVQCRGIALCSLCKKQEETFSHLFFECPWLIFIVLTSTKFSCLVFYFHFFLKSPGTILLILIRLAAITYSVWMIWGMRIHARFQQSISINFSIHTSRQIMLSINLYIMI